jgi:hypothetical protein
MHEKKKVFCALSLSEYLSKPFIEPNGILLCTPLAPLLVTLPHAQSISSVSIALMLHVLLLDENLFYDYFADHNIQHSLFLFTFILLPIIQLNIVLLSKYHKGSNQKWTGLSDNFFLMF